MIKKVWELNGYTSTNNLDIVLELLKKKGYFKIADKKGEIIYTDIDNPATYLSEHNEYNFEDMFISSDFYNKYKEKINSASIEALLNKYSVHVSRELFSDDLIDKLINSSVSVISFNDIELNEEQKNKLKACHKDIFIRMNGQEERLSYINLIGYKKFHELTNPVDENTLHNKKISIDFDTTDRELDNLKYLSNEKELIINPNVFNPFNKETFKKQYELALKTLSKLDEYGLNNKVVLKIDESDYFNKYYLNQFKKYDNMNVIFEHEDINISKYAELNDKLNNLIETVDDSLSPLEKYLSIYDIVKKYKKYKEHPEDKRMSRNLRHIIDNDYMVCVGYARLLNALLAKVGIESADISVSVDSSYDKGFTLEEKSVEFEYHARNIVNIKDDKYDIDGYFVSDPTWDNSKKDSYHHALNTFDSMQKFRYMFAFNDRDAFFDVNNEEEFNKKMNFVINRKISNDILYKKEPYKIKLLNVFKNVTVDILEVLSTLDNEFYIKINDKHQKIEEEFEMKKKAAGYFLFSKMDSGLEKIINETIENYEYLIGEIGEHIINKSNKKISTRTIFSAVASYKNIEDMKHKMLEHNRNMSSRFNYYNEESNIQR